MFLYPLPSYISSFFHALGFSFVDSVKLVFGLSFIASALAMYIWLNEFLSKKGAFVGGLLYMFAPYRFVDLYVRGSIGEHVAFLFPPLVLYFIFKLFKRSEYRYIFLGSVTLSGLILSHNAISLMFLPIFFIYIIFLTWQLKSKKRFIIDTTLLIVFGFAQSTFFWLPAYFEGRYTLRDIVIKGGYINNFASFSQFIYGNWNYGISGQFTLQVAMVDVYLTLRVVRSPATCLAPFAVAGLPPRCARSAMPL